MTFIREYIEIFVSNNKYVKIFAEHNISILFFIYSCIFIMFFLYYLFFTYISTDKIKFGEITKSDYEHIKKRAFSLKSSPLAQILVSYLWIGFIYMTIKVYDNISFSKFSFIYYFVAALIDSSIISYPSQVWNYVFNSNASIMFKLVFLLMIAFIIALLYFCSFLLIVAPQMIMTVFDVFHVFHSVDIFDIKSFNKRMTLKANECANFNYSQIIKDFCHEHNFKENHIILSSNKYHNMTFSFFNLFSFSFVNYIFISMDTVKRGESVTKFVLKHEYAHIKQQACFKSVVIAVLKNLALALYIILDFHLDLFNSGSSEDDNSKLCLNLLQLTLRGSFFCNILNMIAATFQRKAEYEADDFAVNYMNSIDGFLEFTKLHLEHNMFDSIFILHPYWFPFISHPSLYHRYERQVRNLQKRNK